MAVADPRQLVKGPPQPLSTKSVILRVHAAGTKLPHDASVEVMVTPIRPAPYTFGRLAPCFHRITERRARYPHLSTAFVGIRISKAPAPVWAQCLSGMTVEWLGL